MIRRWRPSSRTARLLAVGGVARKRAMWLSVLALVAGLALAASTGAQGSPPCTQPNGCGSANVTLDPTGGQDRGGSTQISSSDVASVHVQWNADCPNSNPPSSGVPGNYWWVDVTIQRADGSTAVYDSAAYGPGPPYSAPPGEDSLDLSVNRTLQADGTPLQRETFTWTVRLKCHGDIAIIGAGEFTMCNGATATSKDGSEFIKQEEALKLHEYEDTAEGQTPATSHNCTIGWGHKIHDGECECAFQSPTSTCETKSEQRFYKGIDEKEAQKLLDADIRTAEKLFVPDLALPLNQCQLDALTDFYLNIGRQGRYQPNRDKNGKVIPKPKKGEPKNGYGFHLSGLAKDLEDGNYGNIPTQILSWDTAKTDPDHNRRAADAAKFSGPCGGC